MGQCNKCSLASIYRRAREYKQKVTLIPDSGKLGGTNVYVHPRSVTKDKIDHKKHFAAWFMAIGKICECD